LIRERNGQLKKMILRKKIKIANPVFVNRLLRRSIEPTRSDYV
jgi:hypothetical protein